MIGYWLALLSALLKYYPIMVLIVVFRDGARCRVAAVDHGGGGALAAFWRENHAK